MERQLKERLIGAAVLVALAVIMVPELFTGMGGGHTTASEALQAQTQLSAASTEQVKTYQIDLQATAQTAAQAVVQPAPAPIAELAPTTEVVADASTSTSASASATASEVSAEKLNAELAKPEVVKTQPAHSASANSTSVKSEVAKSVAAKSEPANALATAVEKPVEHATDKTNGKTNDKTADASGADWVVQVGSFGTSDKAKQIAAELKNQGMSAFVVPVTVTGKTLYRVRIGPMARLTAEATLTKLGKRYVGASVVSATK